MNKVEFVYNGKTTVIQCKENEKMSDIINSFGSKALIENNSLNNLIFNYDGKGGNLFDKTLSFNEMANSTDKGRRLMKVLVYNNNDDINKINNFVIKSNNVICPKCGRNIRLKLNNYKISLFDCKDNHRRDDLSLKEFENSQFINLSKIICQKCKENNKGNTHKNVFYKCCDCNINLCPLCNEFHDKSHTIIDYDQIPYYCEEHGDFYSKYCNKCKINICPSCEEEHSNHDGTYFGKIISKKKDLQAELDELKKYIDKFNRDFMEIMDILNNVKETFDTYYKIKKDIIENFNNKFKNYELLMNLKEISNNDDIIKDINQIISKDGVKNKFNSILKIYDKINQNSYEEEEEEEDIEELKTKYEELERKNEELERENAELELMNEKLEEENSQLKNNDDDENSDKNKKQISLINKIIESGMDPKTKSLTKYTRGNKTLLIELVLTDFIKSEKVANVMLEVDRDDFAPRNSYVNRPQYIGYNVTISAPHMHAFALEYLSDYCKNGAKILDVGSGSGYLTVALSKMTNDTGIVVGIEHIPQLYNFGIENVNKNNSELIKKGKIIFVQGDGREGCKKYGPYKAIHVGAASETVPKALIDQLDYNGRIFIPVGKAGETQHICLVDKDSKGKVTSESILSVCYGMLTDKETQLKDD